jgi:hypothetical protein
MQHGHGHAACRHVHYMQFGHWYAAWKLTSSIDVQYWDMNMQDKIQIKHAARTWACNMGMNMQHRQENAASTCSMETRTQHGNGHAALTCGMEIWTCSIKYNMDMNHGHTMQHRHTAWTWKCSMDFNSQQLRESPHHFFPRPAWLNSNMISTRKLLEIQVRYEVFQLKTTADISVRPPIWDRPIFAMFLWFAKLFSFHVRSLPDVWWGETNFASISKHSIWSTLALPCTMYIHTNKHRKINVDLECRRYIWQLFCFFFLGNGNSSYFATYPLSCKHQRWARAIFFRVRHLKHTIILHAVKRIYNLSIIDYVCTCNSFQMPVYKG